MTKLQTFRLNRDATLLFFIIAFAHGVWPQQILKPEDQETTITGVVRLFHADGPPGYGETPKHDAHIVFWALEVPTPVNLRCTPQRPDWAKYQCASAKRLKLFFPDPPAERTSADAQQWKNKPVTVTG